MENNFRNIGDAVFVLAEIDGRVSITRATVKRINADSDINPAYYVESRLYSGWHRDSDIYETPEELTDNLLARVY